MSHESDSPKTPGGISKSLLTPCRRLGLSRKWKKLGPSPFISPLSAKSSSTNIHNNEKNLSRKREKSVSEISDNCYEKPDIEKHTLGDKTNKIFEVPPSMSNENIVCSPVKNVTVSRKKSKTLMSSILLHDSSSHSPLKDKICVETTQESPVKTELENIMVNNQNSETKSKNYSSPPKSITDLEVQTQSHLSQSQNKTCHLKQNDTVLTAYGTEKQPNNLTKECIVVIQNKILKGDINKKVSTSVQNLCDADSDDEPLSCINKKRNSINLYTTNTNDDFIEIKSNASLKANQSVDKTTLGYCKNSLNVSKSKANKIKLTENNRAAKKKRGQLINLKTLSQSSSYDDDEHDDDFECDKRTLPVKKKYKKALEPIKAKSTGSITQKDIDDLTARIEMKKKLLIAKASSKETEELRNLIKKWQKGCQNALIELLELMKKKLPDTQNMDHLEILQMLKIPPALVGYDSENDCFNTPDDGSIILSAIDGL